jgi:hypothetical protein
MNPIDTARFEQVRRDRSEDQWTVLMQGQLLTVSHITYHPAHKQNTRRGEIIGFSRRARARMVRKIAVIDWSKSGGGSFVTVTYPDSLVVNTSQDRSRHRAVFQRHVERKHGGRAACCWRVEWIARKSGIHEGTILPHMHILYFAVPELGEEFVRRCWAKSIGCDGFVSVKSLPVKVGDMAAMYCAKYCSKEEPPLLLDNVPYRNKTGRHCGWLRKSLIPLCPVEKLQRVSEAMVKFLKGRACDTLWWYDPRFDDSFTLIGPDALATIKEFRKIFLDTELGVE